jgi:hypothetical protein
MREIRPCGFVRGVLGNWHPYRGSQPFRFEKSPVRRHFRTNSLRNPAFRITRMGALVSNSNLPSESV